MFDENSAMLKGFLEGLTDHLTPSGRGVLLLSNIAELLELRPPDFLERELERCGLRELERFDMPAKHGKAKDAADPLYAVRSQEVTSLRVLGPALP